MARTLDPVVHTVRRDAILDVAERILGTRGYEQMSVQGIQDELGVSRGAIYHYFDSKADLLDALVARMVDQIAAVTQPVVDDPSIPALQKLRAFFRASARWKAERRDLLIAVLRAWYSADNAVVRERYRGAARTRLQPQLASIVRQGAAAGVFQVRSPEHVAEILISLAEGLGDASTALFLARLDRRVPYEAVERAIASYAEAIERILGLAPGSLELVDAEALRFWFG
ncbi:MAG TPA: TetR/AcrR family transcriptional regulator [Candidatus Dormibacteraeota bacterium]|nr:TetR/AcrR family transcriptional regulator [Candidatus Dormibacteraeota bacterium]